MLAFQTSKIRNKKKTLNCFGKSLIEKNILIDRYESIDVQNKIEGERE
jgi:hypothetical protein